MNNELSKCLEKSPIGIGVYTSLLFFITSIFIVILFKGSYGKQELVKGIIRQESFYRVNSDKVGNVIDVFVQEKDEVKSGDPLFKIALPWQDVIDVESGSSMYTGSVQRLTESKSYLTKEQQALEKERINLTKSKQNFEDHYASRLNGLSEIEEQYKKKGVIYSAQLKELKILLKSKAINKTEIESLKQAIIDNDIALKKIIADKKIFAQEFNDKNDYYLRAERELLQNETSIERRKQEIINDLNRFRLQKEYIVSSPVDGVVHDVGILKGDFVDGNTPSIIITRPKDNIHLAILYLSSSQIGLIDPKIPLTLRVDTFPYETFGILKGTVLNIASTPTHISIDDKDSWFRVKVRIHDNEPNTKIPLNQLADGMTVTTTLREPKQSLMEWLFLPVKKAFIRNPDFTQR